MWGEKGAKQPGVLCQSARQEDGDAECNLKTITHTHTHRAGGKKERFAAVGHCFSIMTL